MDALAPNQMGKQYEGCEGDEEEIEDKEELYEMIVNDIPAPDNINQ